MSTKAIAKFTIIAATLRYFPESVSYYDNRLLKLLIKQSLHLNDFVTVINSDEGSNV